MWATASSTCPSSTTGPFPPRLWAHYSPPRARSSLPHHHLLLPPHRHRAIPPSQHQRQAREVREAAGEAWRPRREANPLPQQAQVLRATEAALARQVVGGHRKAQGTLAMDKATEGQRKGEATMAVDRVVGAHRKAEETLAMDRVMEGQVLAAETETVKAVAREAARAQEVQMARAAAADRATDRPQQRLLRRPSLAEVCRFLLPFPPLPPLPAAVAQATHLQVPVQRASVPVRQAFVQAVQQQVPVRPVSAPPMPLSRARRLRRLHRLRRLPLLRRCRVPVRARSVRVHPAHRRQPLQPRQVGDCPPLETTAAADCLEGKLLASWWAPCWDSSSSSWHACSALVDGRGKGLQVGR